MKITEFWGKMTCILVAIRVYRRLEGPADCQERNLRWCVGSGFKLVKTIILAFLHGNRNSSYIYIEWGKLVLPQPTGMCSSPSSSLHSVHATFLARCQPLSVSKDPCLLNIGFFVYKRAVRSTIRPFGPRGSAYCVGGSLWKGRNAILECRTAVKCPAPDHYVAV